jgi:hypothetical protein
MDKLLIIAIDTIFFIFGFSGLRYCITREDQRMKRFHTIKKRCEMGDGDYISP